MASDSTGINVINVIRKTDTAGYLQRPYLRKKADVSDPETGSRIDRMVGRNKKISALPVFQRRYIHIGFEVFSKWVILPYPMRPVISEIERSVFSR